MGPLHLSLEMRRRWFARKSPKGRVMESIDLNHVKRRLIGSQVDEKIIGLG